MLLQAQPSSAVLAEPGAQLVVFPEAVLWDAALSARDPRSDMLRYAEPVPAVGATPCAVRGGGGKRVVEKNEVYEVRRRVVDKEKGVVS